MKPITVLVIVTVVFLLFAGCTEEKAPDSDHGGGVTYDCSTGECFYRNLTTELITPQPTPTPTPSPYVMCSDYSKVTDRYKTVNGFYNTTENETYSISEMVYENVSIGGYVKTNFACTTDELCYYSRYLNMDVEAGPNMTPISEEESGYRYACKVLP